MRFRGHESYFIRRGWLSKGMRNVIAHPDVFITQDQDRHPTDMLGLGTSGVKAIRYWLKATGLTTEPKSGKRIQTLTELGELIFKYDRYLEDTNTLWLLHYRLACNRDQATSWYFFFNEFSQAEFLKNDFVEALNSTLKKPVAIRSLEDDFTCLIKTYCKSYEQVSPENNLISPLAELNLIRVASKKDKSYRKCIPDVDSINPWIALAVIMDQVNGEGGINISYLLNNPCNLGRVFNLDSLTLMNLLSRIERTGMIKVIRTAGLDYIVLKSNYTFIDCVREYYGKPSYQI